MDALAKRSRLSISFRVRSVPMALTSTDLAVPQKHRQATVYWTPSAGFFIYSSHCLGAADSKDELLEMITHSAKKLINSTDA